MTNDSPIQPAIARYFRYHCRDCGSEVGFRSRRRSFFEQGLLRLSLMQPVRCGECFRRDYHSILTPVRGRPSEVVRITPAAERSISAKSISGNSGAGKSSDGKRNVA